MVDKTGTLTRGHPEVTEVVAVGVHDKDTALALAAAVERGSEHPLGAAIVRAAEAEGGRGIGQAGERPSESPARGSRRTSRASPWPWAARSSPRRAG